MKKVKIAVLLVTVISFMGLFMLGCSSGGESTGGGDNTPEVGHYTITGERSQPINNVTGIKIEVKAGNSPGAVTTWYTLAGGSSPIETPLPTAAGTYDVTFDVAAADGWYEAKGLSAGQLTITPPTPVRDDYDVRGLGSFEENGSPFKVTVTVKSGGNRSPGAVTVKYNGSTTEPSSPSTYAVTFDVAAATGWEAASGISVGNLTITPTGQPREPMIEDYDIIGKTQIVGSVEPVQINKIDGHSTAEPSNIQYEGKTVTYAKSPIVPTGRGTYTVTFDLAPATPYIAKTLSFEMEIKAFDPTTDIFFKQLEELADKEGAKLQASYTTDAGTPVEISAEALTPAYRVEGWYVGGGFVNTKNNTYTFISSAKGTYTVSVIVSKGGKIYTASTVVTVN